MMTYPQNSDRQPPEPVPEKSFSAEKPELIFLALMALCGLCLCNFTIFAGYQLGFALILPACIWCSFGYLVHTGHRPTAYSTALLVLSTLCALGFARSDDAFVKFVMVCFLFVGINLGLCLLAGQNLQHPNSVRSLLDAPRVLFVHGVGGLPPAFRGLGQAFRANSYAKKGGAFVLGLAITFPVLLVMIPLLMSADAAFDGLIALLPDFKLYEFVVTVIMGTSLSCVLYTRGVSLRHEPHADATAKPPKGISPITVNTVLGAVCLVYTVYLVSQLAYFTGGFAGILPAEYTLAEYARRGFLEMALLSGIDLALICLGLGLVKKERQAPLSTRLLCLFIGFVTLFFVSAASAKMFLYIDSFGLTRLRVLTQIIMLFLALSTAIVMLWLFLPKLPYMKAVLLLALVMGTATIWVDVDTTVASYNVNAYLNGKLETVDVHYLNTLTDGAVPYIAKLQQEDTRGKYATQAKNCLNAREPNAYADLRGWNYVNYIAEKYRPKQ